MAALAGSYRYLLRTGSKRLVPLADELALLDQFLSLVTIRYADGLKVDVQVDAARRRRAGRFRRWCCRNFSKMQSSTTSSRPITRLQIEIRLDGDRLTVSHEKRPRRSIVPSTGVGLENLAQRFRLTTGVAARWGETGGRFVVTLPLVAADGSNIAQ